VPGGVIIDAPEPCMAILSLFVTVCFVLFQSSDKYDLFRRRVLVKL
jgi:hypothetical protein